MIDFRYHIVSIVAVFLALGLGILMGTTVLDRVAVDALRAQVDNLRSDARESRRDITALRTEVDRQRTFADQVSPWVRHDQLAGKPVVFVSDNGGARWDDSVRDAIAQTGARPVGAMTLTAKWKLDAASARQLQSATAPLGAAMPRDKPDESPDERRQAEDALTTLGSQIFAPEGQALLRELVQSGFVEVADADLQQAWPPAGALVVAFTGPDPGRGTASSSPGWVASLARATATATPTLVVSPGADAGTGDVTILRNLPETPATLVTFDAGSLSFGRLGSVLALESAAAGRGGHFGVERGRRLLPERR
ncbi:MAG TPA: copper transporter [Actinomycetota bacterium]|nr:copper transporter [Actinomycetota bacterium]